MKKTNALVLILSVLVLLFSFNLNAFADLGDFNDYSGDSWDSSGSDWGGSSDWGDSDDYDWSSDDDDSGSSWGGSSSNGVYSSSSDDDDLGGGGLVIAVCTVIGIFVLAFIMTKFGKGGNSSPSKGNVNPPTMAIKNNTDEIIQAITKYDENFSNEKFIAWVKEVFITLQTAWSARDFEKARPFEKEELYQQHTTQIKKYITEGRINVIDRINVNQAYLFKYTRDNQYEYMHVYIQARMVDYIKNEKTGAVLKGNPDNEYHTQYIYTFMRKTGVVTDVAKSNKSTVACPHCGAPTNITSAGKCEYCGFIVTTGDFDWVLSNIEAVKANTNFGNGGVVITAKEPKATNNVGNSNNTSNTETSNTDDSKDTDNN